MKELRKEDLQIGDILIFEDYNFKPKKLREAWNSSGTKGAFYYLLHYLIAWFDSGKEGANYKNIYHAGIWGNVDVNRDNDKEPFFENCVVQAGTSGIGCASLESTLAHDTVMNVYVCRMKNRPESFEEDINQAVRDFYKIKGSYSFETAWMLAAICSLRYSKGMLNKMLTDKFGAFAAHLMIQQILRAINDYNDHHQRDMVACSPLVAMMYKNAGFELPVNVFEVQPNDEEAEPNFSLKAIEQELEGPQAANSSEDWPAIKETIVTPRQLMESPEVEMVGVFKRS